MTTTTAVVVLCALDHPVPGRHLDDCDGLTPPAPGKHRDQCTTTDCPGCLRTPCKGCQPAQAADHTHICRWHTGRLTRALGDAPDLITHLHEMIEPGSGAGEERVTRGELAPPAPLRVDAVAAADDLVRVLGSWAARIATERRLTAFLAPQRGGNRRARQITDVLDHVQRLTTHQEHALTANWAAAYVRDITTEIGALRATWPMEERPVYLPVPCPACGASSLARWAPRWQGAPTTICCEMSDCRTVVDEDRYPWLVRLAADLARERR